MRADVMPTIGSLLYYTRANKREALPLYGNFDSMPRGLFEEH